MKKKVRHITLSVLLLLAIFFIAEYTLSVSVTKTALKYVVTLDTHMNKVTFNPFDGCITIQGFKIFNPPGFKEKILADIPLIKMDFKSRTLFEKGTFFDKIVVHIKEITVVKNKEGLTNVSQMKAFTPKEKPKEKIPFLADTYSVKIDKARHIDYTGGGEPAIEEIDLNIEEEYANVEKPDSILKAIGFKLYFNGKLKNMGINVQTIQKELAKLAEKNKKLKEEFEKVAQEKIEAAKTTAKEKIGSTKDAIKDTVEDVKTRAAETKKVIVDKIEDMKERAANK